MIIMIKILLKKLLFKYYKYKLLELGEGTKINPTSTINDKKLIRIGHHSFIGKYCHISIVKPSSLKIGNYVGISPYVKILGGDRNLFTVGKYFMTIRDGQNKPIVIEDDVMIGMDAMILKGVTIYEGSIIGARAVVTKNVLPYTIAVGSPAKMVKLRFTPEELRQHLKIINSRYEYGSLIESYRAHRLL